MSSDHFSNVPECNTLFSNAVKSSSRSRSLLECKPEKTGQHRGGALRASD